MSVRLEPGTPAPAFTLADASGKEHSLSDYAGSKVILYLSEGLDSGLHEGGVRFPR